MKKKKNPHLWSCNSRLDFLLITALKTLQWFIHHVVISLLLLKETRDRHLSVVSLQLQLQNGLDAPHQAPLAVPVRSARIYHPSE